MKIAFFVRSMSNGGAEKVAAKLTCIWASLGYDVVLLTEQVACTQEFTAECVAREHCPKHLLTEEKLTALHAEHHFDWIVFNDGIGDTGFESALRMAKGLPGVKTAIIIHHTANNWMYGTCNSKELFMSPLLAQADALICVDKIWALWWHHRGCKAVFIPNPVSIDQRSSGCGKVKLVKTVEAAANALRGKMNILWVGRLGDQLKRPELSIDVFARVFANAQRVGAQLPKLTMLGTKTASVEKLLHNRLIKGCKEAVKFVAFPGFVADVQSYFNEADAHLFTSATEVTVPQVVLEAQAAGVETVAFDRPFLRHVGERAGVDEIVTKWQTLFATGILANDFASSEDYQNLLDELHCSQQHFVEHHLPELQAWRRLRLLLNPRYLLNRVIGRFA